MKSSDAEYDVYNTPRMGPVQFGDFVAGDANERENLIRNSKYFRRTHRTRPWFAKKCINTFLTSHVKNLGTLDAELHDLKSEVVNLDGPKEDDANASIECLKDFIGQANQLPIHGKDLLPVEDEPMAMIVGETHIKLGLSCLIKTVSKSGNDNIGGLFLNTQVGKGLGAKDATKAKRKKAGETVSLLILRELMDKYSDMGEPNHEDAIHLYVRAQHFWIAPKYYSTKLKDIEADGRAIGMMWDGIQPPSDFDPEKAIVHD